jgi:hypothetical protein
LRIANCELRIANCTDYPPTDCIRLASGITSAAQCVQLNPDVAV